MVFQVRSGMSPHASEIRKCEGKHIAQWLAMVCRQRFAICFSTGALGGFVLVRKLEHTQLVGMTLQTTGQLVTCGRTLEEALVICHELRAIKRCFARAALPLFLRQNAALDRQCSPRLTSQPVCARAFRAGWTGRRTQKKTARDPSTCARRGCGGRSFNATLLPRRAQATARGNRNLDAVLAVGANPLGASKGPWPCDGAWPRSSRQKRSSGSRHPCLRYSWASSFSSSYMYRTLAASPELIGGRLRFHPGADLPICRKTTLLRLSRAPTRLLGVRGVLGCTGFEH